MNASTSFQVNSRKARWMSGINVLAGAWLFVAPFVLGYVALRAALWNDMLVGATIFLLALVRAITPGHSPALSWVNVLLGLWLIVAPFALLYGSMGTTSGPAAATGNDIVVGIIVLALAYWSARASHGLAGEGGSSLKRTSASTGERGGPNV